jgi:dienelactone hydrolase
MKALVGIITLVVGLGAVAFHPSRPFYMKHRDIAVRADDGVVLSATLAKPRWTRRPARGVVLVHGSGPLTRRHLLGDTRRLVRLGFAVLVYDKRGAGASAGTYLQSRTTPPEVLLGRLAADAAAAFDSLSDDPDVDTTRIGFFGASQAGWIIPLAAERTRTAPRFQVILSGNAVPTGVEQYYSDLTGDGNRAPQVNDAAEIERRVLGFEGPRGFDPAPILSASRIPTLWLLGNRDESGPTFATVRVLDSIRAAGNDQHTVIRYPNANHALRDTATGESVPLWDDMMNWLARIGVG